MTTIQILSTKIVASWGCKNLSTEIPLHMKLSKTHPNTQKCHFQVFHIAEDNFIELVGYEIKGMQIVLDSYSTLYRHCTSCTGGPSHPQYNYD